MRDLDQLAAWLASQALDNALEIDGESVWLRVHDDGAELAACLWRDPSGAQLQEALKQGFASARAFDAGLGLADDGRGLMLSCWLADCRGWVDAAPALDRLLEQMASWRAALAPGAAARAPERAGASRQEQRMRAVLAKGLR